MPREWSDTYLDRLEQGKSAKVAIAIFEGPPNAGVPKGLDVKLDEMLTTSIVQTGRFDVVERSKLEQIKAEQKLALDSLFPGGFASKSLIDSATAPKLGKLLGAQGIVLVSVTSATQTTIDKFAYDLQVSQVTVNARAIDTTTGKIFVSEDAPGKFEQKLYTTADRKLVIGTLEHEAAFVNALRDALQKIAPKISSHYPPLGYVVKVTDDKIYLDVGEDRGARPGDYFIVFRKGDEIREPRTSARIGWEKEVIGAVSVASLQREMSIARLVKLNDRSKPIVRGDVVVSAGPMDR
jgi:hypothetical protein